MGKRKVKTFLLLCMLIAVLSGCGKDMAPGEGNEEGDDLLVWENQTTIIA